MVPTPRRIRIKVRGQFLLKLGECENIVNMVKLCKSIGWDNC